MDEEQIGTISHYYNHLSVGIIELTAPLKIGETIRIKGATDDFTETIESMQVEHEQIEEANAGDSIGVKVSQKVHENDKVYRVTK